MINKEKWSDIVIEEFKAIRAEMLSAQSMAQAILGLGIAAIATVISGGIKVWTDDSVITILIFLFFIPSLCYLVLTMWMGENARIIRAGIYIKDIIQPKINELFSKNNPPLYWETYIRSFDKTGKKRLFKWHRLITVMLLIFTSMSSIVIGNIKLWNVRNQLCELIEVNILEFLVLLLVVIINYNIGRRFN